QALLLGVSCRLPRACPSRGCSPDAADGCESARCSQEYGRRARRTGEPGGQWHILAKQRVDRHASRRRTDRSHSDRWPTPGLSLERADLQDLRGPAHMDHAAGGIMDFPQARKAALLSGARAGLPAADHRGALRARRRGRVELDGGGGVRLTSVGIRRPRVSRFPFEVSFGPQEGPGEAVEIPHGISEVSKAISDSPSYAILRRAFPPIQRLSYDAAVVPLHAAIDRRCPPTIGPIENVDAIQALCSFRASPR